MKFKSIFAMALLTLNSYAFSATTGNVGYDEAVQNPDENVTFIRPQMYIQNEWRTFSAQSNATGVCLRLGLQDGVISNLTELGPFSIRPVVVNESGDFKKVLDFGWLDFSEKLSVDAITCW